MSISLLPTELLYNVFADIVAEYVDSAITQCPKTALPGPNDKIADISIAADHTLSDDELDEDPRFELTRRHRPMDYLVRWTVAEALEPLLDTAHLVGLLTVNHQFYNVLSKVLDDALGRPTQIPRDRFAVLKELRAEYRRTLTPSLPAFDISVKNVARTPLIRAYIRVIQAQHFLRDVKAVVYKPNEYTPDAIKHVDKCFLGSFKKLIPQEAMRGRVKQRMVWAKARIGFFKDLITICKKAGINLHAALLCLRSPSKNARNECLEDLENTIQELIDYLEQTTSLQEAMEHLLMPHIVSHSSIQKLFTTLSELPLRSIPSVDPEWLERMLDVQEWGSHEKKAWDHIAEKWDADYEELAWDKKLW